MTTSKFTFTKFIQNFVLALFFTIISILFLFSITITCTINIDEIISWKKDYPLLHIIFLCCICYIFALYSNKKHTPYLTIKFLSGIFLAVMLLFIYKTQLFPKADQLQIMILSTHIADGNYQDFLPGGYLYNQPHQIFITYFSSLLYMMFGNSYFYFFQILNAFSILGTYYILLKIYEQLDMTNCHPTLFYLISFIFLPYTLYITFQYGTSIGLFLALAAGLHFLRYMKCCYSYHSMLWCVILIILSYLFKSNYLIFLFGFLAVLIFDLMKKLNIRHIIFCIILICSLTICNYTINTFTEHLTGVHSDGGVPKILFAAMGLMESNLAPGWWNGYHDKTFIENNCDVELSKEAGRKKIAKRIEKMKEKPLYGISFFLKKLSSEWSEPTYESIWIQQHRDTMTKIPFLLDRLIHNGGRLSAAYIFYCNLFQSFLYFGTLLFLISYWKNLSSEQLFIPSIFIGGFLFHIVWEAKGQYTLPYCVCLLPLCIHGYEAIGNKLFSKKLYIFKKTAISISLLLILSLIFRALFFELTA